MTKYAKATSKKVEKSIREMHEEKLKSGSGRKVTNPKQATTIGISEAREEGEKVPGKSSSGKPASKSSSKKSTSLKPEPKKGSTKK